MLNRAWIAGLLWLGTALLILLSAVLVTRACGTILPFLDYCQRPVTETDILQERHDALLRERDLGLERLNRAAQCVPRQRSAMNSCQAPPADEVIVLMDVSFSMGFDYNIDPALQAEIARVERAQGGGLFDSILNRALLEELHRRTDTPALPDRIDVAREALRPLVTGLPENARLKLLSFAQCSRPPRLEGVFGRADDTAYQRAIDRLSLRSETALARAIAALPGETEAGRTPDRPLNIVIITDGADGCGNDPCAAAAQLKRDLPHAHVSVVSMIAGEGVNSCIAEATGGQFFAASQTEDLVLRLRQFTGQLSADECAAIAPTDLNPNAGESQ